MQCLTTVIRCTLYINKCAIKSFSTSTNRSQLSQWEALFLFFSCHSVSGVTRFFFLGHTGNSMTRFFLSGSHRKWSDKIFYLGHTGNGLTRKYFLGHEDLVLERIALIHDRDVAEYFGRLCLFGG